MLGIMRTVTNTCSSGESTAFVTNFRIKRRNITYYLYSNPKVVFFYLILCYVIERRRYSIYKKKKYKNCYLFYGFLLSCFLYLCMTNRY